MRKKTKKKNQKAPKKHQKTIKTKNKPLGWFFFKPCFFQPCLDHLYDGLAAGGRNQMLVKVGQLLEPGHHLPEQKLVAMMLLHLEGFGEEKKIQLFLSSSVFFWGGGGGEDTILL
jgi:hypothetical protein